MTTALSPRTLPVITELPSRKLRYPPDKAYLKMIFLFPSWDMLVPWRVTSFTQRPRAAKSPFSSKILSTTKQGPSMSFSEESMIARRRRPAKTLDSLSPHAKSIPLKLPLLYVPPFLWKYQFPQVACLGISASWIHLSIHPKNMAVKKKTCFFAPKIKIKHSLAGCFFWFAKNTLHHHGRRDQRGEGYAHMLPLQRYEIVAQQSLNQKIKAHFLQNPVCK